MARILAEAPMTTKAARSRLGSGLYWRGLDAELHLGYRKGKRSGRWVVRWFSPDRSYRQETIATADDRAEADGTYVLTFQQASKRALKAAEAWRFEAAARAAGVIPTVRAAALAYVEAREAIEKETGRFYARGRFKKHILGDEIADLELHRLTELDLRQWRSRLAPQLAHASIRRINSDLKAALNAAARDYRERLPPHMALVIKNGLAMPDAVAPVARAKALLTDAHIRRVLAAADEYDRRKTWDGDFYRMIFVLAATGARFSQIVRMTVADVQVVRQRLMVPVSRKGRGPKRADRVAVPVGEDTLSALRPAIAGRRGDEILLLRPRWKQVAPTRWEIVDRGPWKNPSELKRPWAEIRTAVGLSAEVPPYALRHSSIVRGLSAGLPIRLVAALHDTSSTMIESHYAAYITSALDELAARAVVPLAPSAEVVPLKQVR